MAEAEYIALKTLQVHELDEDGEPKLGNDGRPVLRICKPGDPIPEATSWNSLWKEVRCGRVGMAGTALAGPALADSMRRKLADAGRPKNRRGKKAAAKPAPTPDPEPAVEPEAEAAPDEVETVDSGE